MKTLIHLVPFDGIGGVETAARTMEGIKPENFNFDVEYIFDLEYAKARIKKLSILRQTVESIFRVRARKPDMVIVSLWRSCLVGLVLKLLDPQLKLVLFLHYPKDTHWLDAVVTRITSLLAIDVWGDSKETLSRRLQGRWETRGRVISFVTRHIAVLPTKPVSPQFIFWGRVHSQKNLTRALHIFSSVVSTCPTARFTIIGPDGGELAMIREQARDSGLSASVQFLGSMCFTEIANEASQSSFYLQTSELEGMAMSVVEAMQLGLVPVVTPVGQIRHYCTNGKNALLIQSEGLSVAGVLALLADEAAYQDMRKRAVATWADAPLYADSVLQACSDILSSQ